MTTAIYVYLFALAHIVVVVYNLGTTVADEQTIFLPRCLPITSLMTYRANRPVRMITTYH